MMEKTAKKPKNTRQNIWTVLRKNKDRFLTINEISEAAAAKKQAAYAYLSSLSRGGYISVQKDFGFMGLLNGYRLERDVGIDAPRLAPDGSELKSPATEAMWRTMKILKTFDLEALFVHVHMTHDISWASVKGYTAALEAAGYLKNTGSARKKTFVMLKNTGARAPQVLAVKEVYDPNTDEIVYRQVPDYD